MADFHRPSLQTTMETNAQLACADPPLHWWQAIYDTYRFDEPWDGPSNRQLLDLRLSVYACPSEAGDGHEPHTSYLAVVDDSTAWTTSGRKLSEIDDPERTVMLVEHHAGIHWLEPRDLTLEEALQVLPSIESRDTGHTSEGNFAKYYTRCIAWADGHTKLVSPDLGRTIWASTLTVGDENKWDEADLQPSIYKERKRESFIRVVVLGILTLFPLPWVWRNPTSKT